MRPGEPGLCGLSSVDQGSENGSLVSPVPRGSECVMGPNALVREGWTDHNQVMAGGAPGAPGSRFFILQFRSIVAPSALEAFLAFSCPPSFTCPDQTSQQSRSK
ncbi:hypothetical protein DPEC_G00317260 [Dallia pectoralis]|uniref:Uncharacterized protein n=1 Tax=Dallia pectoralis TaxID=75939 RepID=A0ACC2FD63_DALPE|nr:hypothetical protein DPEC_G00317260 [Dallia pectoralis]